jgi:hypothetical protein
MVVVVAPWVVVVVSSSTQAATCRLCHRIAPELTPATRKPGLNDRVSLIRSSVERAITLFEGAELSRLLDDDGPSLHVLRNRTQQLFRLPRNEDPDAGPAVSFSFGDADNAWQRDYPARMPLQD